MRRCLAHLLAGFLVIGIVFLAVHVCVSRGISPVLYSQSRFAIGSVLAAHLLTAECQGPRSRVNGLTR